MLQETYTLSNGKQIPKLGLGTWFIDDDKAAEQAYGNERGVGEGIHTGGVQREELLVVSKVAAGHKTYEDKCRGFPVYDGKI